MLDILNQKSCKILFALVIILFITLIIVGAVGSYTDFYGVNSEDAKSAFSGVMYGGIICSLLSLGYLSYEYILARKLANKNKSYMVPLED